MANKMTDDEMKRHLMWMASGWTNEEIAQELGFNEDSISRIQNKIYARLSIPLDLHPISKRSMAIAIAFRRKLIN